MKMNTNNSYLVMRLPSTFFSASNHLGINITVNSVWVIGVDDHKKIVFKNSVTSQTPFFSGDVVEVEPLAAALKQAVTGAPQGMNSAAVCFPERLAYSREYALPKINLSEITEAITWQLPKIFPLDVTDIYIDWKLLSQTDSEVKTVVVAVAKKYLDGLQQACILAGIQPLSFEPSASVLARAQPDQNQAHIILEVDSFGTSATLIEKGISSLTTTTTFTADSDLDSIIRNINTSVTNLLAHYHADSQTAEKLQVFITGEKATSKLTEYVSQTSGLAGNLLSLPIDQPGLHVPYLAALSALLPPESEHSINLLPTILQQRYQLEINIALGKRTLLVSSGIAAAALVTAIAVYISGYMVDRSLVKTIAQTVMPSAPTAAINVPLVMNKAQMVLQLTPLKQMPVPALQKLIEMGILSHQTAKHVSYDASKKSLQITLSQVDRNSLFAIKENLEKTNLFTSITVPLSVFGSAFSQEVTMTLIVK